ncbi:surfactin synthase thioesterase subunit [Streptomyces puniciscabiei]|uniref:Surfactin synthase thioesterase subunit n=1 Tax=Streptomyces puniciscabiei TaxID=164348 RepID=A0A542UGZ9_9ACTN|nr:alpha/beta fold hydrolase [Streptomyces puniciscabiei]TQK98342.1 surfactin synthase thioesterase subunit [Streptomyces puniciscabiei]
MTNRITSPSSLWFQPSEAGPDAALRLFLFPHAGSGASIYKEWPGLLPADIAHHCVQLPGRQDRSSEETFTEMEPLVEALQEAITQELDDRPYAFFGHCMGAQLAYRLAVALEKSGRPGPVLVGVSGWAPKDFKTPTLEQAYMPVEELKGWIRALGSVPAEIMDDPKALEMIIPAMRADLAVVASYLDDGAAIGCPVVSYSGNRDQLMERGAMASWVDRTSSYLGNSEFNGDHFYMNDIDNTIGVISDLVRHIRRTVAAS